MITYQKEKYTDEEIYRSLNPLTREWFENKFKVFSPPQRFAVLDIKKQMNTLISSPTGSGKTLSAFLTVIDELVTLNENDELEDKIYALYVSPLKALSNDIERNLNGPLKEIKELFQKKYGKIKKWKIRVGVRTGDTTASQKSGMLRKPPHILITTPESLAIVLSSAKFKEKLFGINWCIIDEIHSLADSKRGVHLSLSLERLQKETEFTRIGLSATVSPLDDVARFLVGGSIDKYGEFVERDCSIVDSQYLKKMDMKVLCPVPNFINTTHEKMSSAMYRQINDLIQKHKTTLIFTNTRAGTERVVHHLKDIYPRNYGAHNIGAHHGSLSKEHRLMIENKLKAGELKVVVSSTSLELGIDIGYIDLVILLGSPKSVARALQRIGRSGHQLHETAKGRIIVLDRDDLVECSVLLKSAIEKKIDNIQIQENSLDVLAQHIYGIAINEPIEVDEVYNLVRQSYCYKTLDRHDFDEIINYLAGEYVSLEERRVYAKIWYDPETKKIGKRSKLARVLYMTNIGTIPDTTGVTVKIGNESIGMIDEGFLEKLKAGDVFVLGGNTYIFQYSRGMTAQVKTSIGRPPTVPSWVSEQLPLSFDLGLEIQKFRKFMDDQFMAEKTKDEIMKEIDDYLYVDSYGANAIYEYFKEQFLFAEIPHHKKIVIEHYNDPRKKYIVFHTLFGRRTNDVLSRAVAYAISRQQHKDVEIGINDNGFYVSTDGKVNIMKAFKALHSNELRALMELALDKTEILKRRFRHCASRSLMILRSYMGRTRTVGRQQMSSQLLITAVRRISEDFPILKEAKREILEELMDIKHAEEVLHFIENKKMKVKEINTDVPSPFSFNLVMQGYSDIMKIEDKIEFLKRMHECVVERIENKSVHTTVEEISEEMRERIIKRTQEELTKEQSLLIKQIRNLKGLAMDEKLELMNVVKNLDDEVSPKTYEKILTKKDEILKDWPKALSRFLILKAAEHNTDFDYDSYWNQEEEQEKIKEDLKVEQLKQDFINGARRVRLEANLQFEGMRLIEGDNGHYKKEFVDWLDTLLSGTVPMFWSTDLIKFFKRRLGEIK
jgi:ATP-dependent Lhr-like helicase